MKKKYRIKNPFKLLVIIIIDWFGNKVFNKHNKPLPKKIDNILLVRKDNLGDMVLTIPLIDSIARNLNCKIDIYGNPKWKDIFRDDKRINQYYSQPPYNNNYSLIIDMKGGDIKTLIEIKKIKSKLIIGFGDAGFGFLYDIPLFEASQSPVKKTDMIIGEMGFQNKKSTFPGKIILTNVSEKQSYLIIQPFSSRKEKNPPINQMVNIATTLKNTGFQVLICGTFDEQKLLSNYFNGFKILCFKSSELFNYIKTIAEANLIIAPDSAPIHIAASTGTKSIALFGKEDAAIWHPYNSNSQNIFINFNNIKRNINEQIIIKKIMELSKAN